jgi:malate dehydrogenase (quinone)
MNPGLSLLGAWNAGETMAEQRYDILIIGGGVSGTALLYTLARYTDVPSVGLLEKYGEVAALNSSADANSQTLHSGDIETNYTLEKARQVKQVAAMVVRYGALAPDGEAFMRRYPKMVLAVGEAEVAELEARHAAFAEAFPYMELWDREAIARIEPAVATAGGRPRPEPVVASGCTGEVSGIDFGRVCHSFVDGATRERGEAHLHLNTQVNTIEETGEGYRVHTNRGLFSAGAVAVCAGAHSLYLAHGMGYGLEYGLLPVAGSFYFIPRELSAKVYTLQDPKLPFAALHVDPDITNPGRSRVGPTALVLPKLERYRPGTYLDFLRVLRPDRGIARAFWALLKDAHIRAYIQRNLLFEVPVLRQRLFLRDARRILPDLTLAELTYAHGIGGVRPQVIDRRRGVLLLGEAMVDPGTGILFNITPSPGASTCLGNAYRNARHLTARIGRRLDEDRLIAELLGGEPLQAAT